MFYYVVMAEMNRRLVSSASHPSDSVDPMPGSKIDQLGCAPCCHGGCAKARGDIWVRYLDLWGLSKLYRTKASTLDAWPC